jgi:hypothetical protein
MGSLFRLDPSSGQVRQSFKTKTMILDICTDGRFLYQMEGDWTAGAPIDQMDPATGKTVREIVTEENKKNKASGAKGIAWVAGKLCVLSGMDGIISEVDPATGKVTREIKTPEKWITGLDYDGRHFVTGSKTDLILLDVGTGAVVRKVPVNYPLRSVAYHDGAYYLMEQPVFGFDKNNKSVQIWPKETFIYKLTLDSSK